MLISKNSQVFFIGFIAGW